MQRAEDEEAWYCRAKHIINCLELRSSKRSIDQEKLDGCQMINRSGDDHLVVVFG